MKSRGVGIHAYEFQLEVKMRWYKGCKVGVIIVETNHHNDRTKPKKKKSGIKISCVKVFALRAGLAAC